MASKSNELRVSRGVQMNFRCTWSIEKYSSLDSEIGKCHRSENFYVQENQIEWSLLLYPGGETQNSQGYVSVFAQVKSEIENLLLKYSISLRNTKNEILFVLESKDWIVSMTRGYGNSNAIEVQDLMSKLVDDTLMVVLDLNYCSTCIKDDVGISHYAENTPIMKMVDDFKNLVINKESSDGSSQSNINIHSSSKKLTSHCKNNLELTSDAKKYLFSYKTYGSLHELNIDLALELIRTTSKHEQYYLNTYCSHYLTSVMDRDNVCKILLHADEYNMEKVRSYAIKYFILANFSKKDFEAKRSILNSQPELIRDIVKEFDNKKEQWKLT